MSVKISLNYPPALTANAPILVPTHLKRYGLSEIVNHLIGTQKQFNFIINKKFLTTSLNQFLIANNLSNENTLDLEVVDLSEPPQSTSSIPQDDWISCIKIDGRSQLIATGSFDSHFRIFNKSQTLLSSFKFEKAVKAIQWSNELILVAAGESITALKQVGDDQVEKVYFTEGHEDTVTDVAISKDGSHFASSSWDKTIRVWSSETTDVVQKSFKKKAAKRSKIEETEPTKQNHDTLEGHSGAVHCVLFRGNDQIISGSADHSVRLWNAETLDNLMTFNTESVVTTIQDHQDLVITGHPEGQMKFWDPRAKGIF